MMKTEMNETLQQDKKLIELKEGSLNKKVKEIDKTLNQLLYNLLDQRSPKRKEGKERLISLNKQPCY